MVAPEGTGDLSRSLVRVPGSGYDRQAMPSTCDLGRVSSLAATVPINPRLPSIITNTARPAPSPPKQQQTEAEASAAKLGHKEPGLVKQGKQPVRTQPYVVPKKNGNQQANANPANPTGPQGATATTIPFPPMPAPRAQPVELPANFMANKQARITYMTAEQVLSLAPNILHANTPAGPLLFMHVHPQTNKATGAIRKVPTRPPLVPARPNSASSVQETSNSQQGSGVTVVTLEQLIRDQATLRQENEALQQQVTMFQQLFQDRARLEEVVRQLGIKIDTN